MIRVTVKQRDTAGQVIKQGHLDFEGLKLRLPDGGLHVERDARGRPIPEEVVLRPPGLVPPAVAVRIGQALARGDLSGTTDGYEWSTIT
jgi:hypothetical protein